MPGRAVNNEFAQTLDQGPIKVRRCYNCLVPCDPRTTPYCISDALMGSVKGEGGLIFAGSNAWRVNKIVKVQELIDELVQEAEAALDPAE